MTEEPVTLIGEFDDLDLDRLRRELEHCGHEVHFLPLGRYADEYEIAWDLSDSRIVRHGTTTVTLSTLNDSHAILFKLWTMDERPLVAIEPEDGDDHAFAAREWKAALSSALDHLLARTSSRAYGSPREASWHDWKPRMLAEAVQFGCRVPQTAIAMNLNANAQSSVVKPINANPLVFDGSYFPTTAIDEEIALALKTRTGVPNLVQHRVRRDRERRSILLGDRLLTIEFRLAVDIVDARYAEAFDIIDIVDSPASSTLLGRFAHTMGFSYCCFDCIIDANSTEWLIDVTPRGSWHWIEDDNDPTVSQLIVEVLRS